MASPADAEPTNFIATVPATMYAWTAHAYGGPEVLERVSLPVPHPAPQEILVRVQATTVSSADRRIRARDFPRGLGLIGRCVFGIQRPRRKVLGAELTGIVVAMGARVRRFSVGDAVIALNGARLGAHAEYVTLREHGAIIHRPADMPVPVAAALAFGGSTALHFLQRAVLAVGERVLVIGASGTVGSALVQLAVAAGATVTAVTSAANADLVRGLGAMKVICYDEGQPIPRDEGYDVVADTVGNERFASAITRLARGGRFLAINGSVADMVARPRNERRCIAGPAAERATDLAALSALWGEGRYVPLIDRVVPFAALREAHTLVDSGRKRGSVVVRVAEDG